MTSSHAQKVDGFLQGMYCCFLVVVVMTVTVTVTVTVAVAVAVAVVVVVVVTIINNTDSIQYRQMYGYDLGIPINFAKDGELY